ncbi:protein RRC1 [Cryptomeria japonica]|uniref:protein RRC1 n=1 Tax=Cryptomeria japonica TaxID=3369 RepID=UPI0027D9EE9B|nr:protein RRC1 [Cryptomeria japonica]
MNSFSVVRKKTPFQKHREEEEAKKKREDDEAARLYEEFVQSFNGDDIPCGKTFVRGGTINPNERLKSGNEDGSSKDGSSSSKKGSRYIPSFIPPGMAGSASLGKETDKKREDEKSKEKAKGKMRNIDNFMEELKLEREMREKRNQDREHRQEGRPNEISMPVSHFDEIPEELDSSGRLLGSFDDGDPQTTNLYVGNLSPQVDENFLLRTFGRFGPIASVKIMWPRTEEEHRRQRNCGFVAFMNRADGQAAKDEMQGVVVYEYELKIGWGKSVTLPSQALPAPPPGHMAVRNKEGHTVTWSGPGGPSLSGVTSQVSELVVTPNIPDIGVIPPEDEHQRHVIDTMAMYVLDDGCSFEQAIMERGRGNALFNFLFDLGSKEHSYYVWRLYSFSQGDTLQRWRTEPFIMITGSGRWIPPQLPQQTGKSPEHERDSGTTYAAGRSRRVDLERPLTESQRDEFEDMLRALTLERSQIKEAMGFALDNADAAGEVVEVLTESLTLKETLLPIKVARLMLVSDILHNSSAPVKNASAYRTKFEATLPDIMESFNDLYRAITGRITAEALKERVLKVLQVWSDWFLFSDVYVSGLRATFLRPGNSGVSPFHSICGDAPPVKGTSSSQELGNDVLEGTKENQDAALAIGKGAAVKELSSLPLAELERRCRHNGLSIRGGREMMVARLLSLDEAEKQKAQDHDAVFQYGRSYPLRHGRESNSTSRSEGKWNSVGGWSTGSGEWKEVNLGAGREQRELSQNLGDSSGWPYHEDGMQQSALTQSPKLAIPQPELKPFASKAGKTEPILPASKWTREDEGGDAEGKQDAQGLGLGYSSSGSEDSHGIEKGERQEATVDSFPLANDTGMNEEQRQKLRKLEVAVMEYRESLEERGMSNLEEIERKVDVYRKKIKSEFGLTDETTDGENTATSRNGKQSTRVSESISSDRKNRRNEHRNSSSKKHAHSRRSHSMSPHKASRDRDREREVNRDRDREREKEIVRDCDRDRLRERDWERDRVRELETERGREREKSSSRDRDDHDRDMIREKDRGRDRDGDRERERKRKVRG